MTLLVSIAGCGSGASDEERSSGGAAAGTGSTGAGPSAAGSAGTTGSGGTAATSGAAGSGPGGGDAGASGGTGGTPPLGACGDGGPSPAGWVDLVADVSNRGQGAMQSPIQRCESSNGRFAVLAKGTERDEVDSTIMRIQIEGYSGPGTYSGGLADGVEVDVFHSDVGGCDPEDEFTLLFGAPPELGTFMYDGTSSGLASLCVYYPGNADTEHDRLVYCAFERAPNGDGMPDPAEAASVTVDELPCDGGGVRGHLQGHLVYRRTLPANGAAEVVDPAHAGEGIDVSFDFDIVDGDRSP